MTPHRLLPLLGLLCLLGCEREPLPVVSNTPPDITLESPTHAQSVRVGQELRLTAHVQDAEEGPAFGERVVWVASGSGQLARGSTATVTFSEPGEQTLTATVVDSGDLVASASVTLQVLGALAPSVLIREPAADSAWNLGQVLPLNCEARSLTGELLPDSAIQWTSALSGPLQDGAQAQTMLGVAGEDTLTCTATDPSTGARASVSVPLTVRSTQAPSVQILRPETELYVKTGQPAPYSSTVTFRASAYDFNVPSNGENLSAAIEWTLEPGGTRLGTGEAVTYTFTTPGEHLVMATATDSRGTRALDSVRVHLVTNLPPRCTLLWPLQDDARLLQGAPSELEASCLDPETGQELPPTWRTSASAEPLGEGMNLSVVLSAPGAQALSACATDPQDPTLVGCGERPVRVITNSAPQDCAIQTPLARANVNAGVDLELRGSATDAEDPQLDLRYRWSSNRDGLLGQGAHTTVRQLSSPGNHTLMLTVMDPWGLTCSASIPLSVNGAPAVGISKVEQGSTNCLLTHCHEGVSLTITGSASDSPEGVERLEWLDSLLGGFGTTSTAAQSSPVTGKHTLVLRATDRSGAVGRAAVSFAVLPANRDHLIDTLGNTGSPIAALSFAPGAVYSVDGKTASVLRVPLPSGSTTSVPLRGNGLSLFHLGTSGGPVLFVGTTEGVERCVGTTCTRYQGGALSSSGKAVRAVAALEAPDLLLLGTDEGLLLTRASDPSAGGAPGTLVGRRVLEGTAVRQVLISPASTARELKLWAATDEGLAELTVSVETPFEPAVALVTSVLHGPPALPDKDVRAVTVSPEGRVYAGTVRGWGALGQPGPTLKGAPWSFPDEEVKALVFERAQVGGQVRDVLWAGTRRGLIRYDLGRDIATRFDSEDGLPNEDVSALARGAEGIRYIGTTSGLSVYAGP